MTNFLHWHTMTWVLVLWSGYIATWMVVTGPGPSMVALWWLAGMIVFGLLWLARQPPLRQRRGLPGLFAGTDEGPRTANVHQTTWATEPRRDAS